MSTSDATAMPGELVVVTGMTGAGRSTAAKELEDLGYYVIDNLPAELLEPAIEAIEGSGEVSRLAIVVDARSGSFFAGLGEKIVKGCVFRASESAVMVAVDMLRPFL